MHRELCEWSWAETIVIFERDTGMRHLARVFSAELIQQEERVPQHTHLVQL